MIKGIFILILFNFYENEFSRELQARHRFLEEKIREIQLKLPVVTLALYVIMY
jgi:hypothetical protein